jgi:hypothetical protein
MFEKASRIAEKLATGVSRRGFLRSFGRWAGAAALGLAGVLTTAGTARADSSACCGYGCSNGTTYLRCSKGSLTCEPPKPGCSLILVEFVGCDRCRSKKGTGGGG